MQVQTHSTITPTVSQAGINYIPFNDDDAAQLDAEEAEYEAWLIAKYESEIEYMGVPSIDSIAFAEMARR